MNKKKKSIQRILCAGLSITSWLTMMPIPSVMAAGSVGVSFNCGEGATVCPPYKSRDYDGGTRFETMTVQDYVVHVAEWFPDDYWKNYDGSPLTAQRPGYVFKGWKTSKTDTLINWNTDLMSNVGTIAGNTSLDLIAVWEPAASEQQNSIPISVSVAATPINVTLPTRIDIAFNTTSVEGQIADSLLITNNGKTGNVVVQNVRAELTNPNWTFTTQTADSYFQLLPLDSNQIYLGFSKDNSTYTTLSEQSFDPGIMISPAGLGSTPNFSPFYLKAKTGGRSSSIQESIMNLVLTIGFESAAPDTGLEINDGAVTAYTGNTETLILPMNVTSINSKALADHPELKTVINNTGRSFDWFDALGETDTRDIPTPAFSEGSTNNVLIASQTTMDNYSEPFRSQLLSGEIKLTPDSYLTVDSSGLLTDYTETTAVKNPDVVLPAMKNGQMIIGIDEGTVNGKKYDSAVSSVAIARQSHYVSPFTDIQFGDGRAWDVQNKAIKSIIFPDSIERIGAVAFASLAPIEIKNIPESLTSIGYHSFMNANFADNLADFSNSKLTSIGEYCFYSAKSITEIRLPATVDRIGNNAFFKAMMPNLTTIINPNGKSFDWTAITGSTISGQNFATGTINHKSGNIAVRSSSDMYIISYDLNGHGDMDGLVTSYTPRTETFTIGPRYSSLEDGDCLWNGWSTPTDPTAQYQVTIEKGSNGDRKYIANWRRCGITP